MGTGLDQSTLHVCMKPLINRKRDPHKALKTADATKLNLS